MDNFALNKTGWFTVEIVEPNDFLNDKLENDMYGIYYTVKFEGDASTHLWQAKKAPEVGEKVYGHIEMAKSGKSTKFKRAKKEEIPQEEQTTLAPTGANPRPADDYWNDKDASIRAQWAIGQAKDWALGNDMDFDEIEVVANEFFGMVQRVKGGLSVADVKKAIPDVVVEPEDGPITYEDIPDFA